jgi:hypothetical protein
MRAVHRTSLVAGVVLGLIWIGWRGPHLVDDARYAVATPWPGTELVLADDATVEIGGRRMTVAAGMGVDCMPGVVPIPLPQPECRGPGLGVRLSAKSGSPAPALPRPVHARVESEGVVWETDLIESEGSLYRVAMPPSVISRAA